MTDLLQQLQFLRPAWLYGFIPLALLVLYLLRRKPGSRSWAQVCDKALLPHVLVEGGGRRSRLPALMTLLAGSLCLLALAGPVLEKLPQPVFRDASALVIALDLSSSMRAADIKPSRLERARLKLTDILDARKGGQIALIVYAANAFTVTPLTDDINTIANLLPALEPELMPAQGSEASRALELANTLLRQAGVQRGDVLLVTDNIRADDGDAIAQLRTAGHRLSIMGVGTPAGGPIPLSGGFLQDSNGAIVVPKLDAVALRKAAEQGGGIYAPLVASDADVSRLTALFGSEMPRPDSEELEMTADTWREEGPWLLLALIPLAAMWPRQGWIAVFVILVLPVSEPAYAIDTQDLWSRPDQRGMRAFRQGDTEQAAELFEHPHWKASAWYRSGDYEKALESMPEPVTADDYYNRGNALAKLGRYQEAIEAYDEALDRKPGDEDATFNRELVQKQLEQQPEQQSTPQDPQDADEQQQAQQQDSDQQQQDQQQSQQENQQQYQERDQQQEQQAQNQESREESSASEQDGEEASEQADASPEPKTGDEDEQHSELKTPDEEQARTEQDDNSEEQAHRGEESEDADRENTEFTPSEQQARENAESERIATEQWLRRIPDDPGGLLRRKFLYQYRQMPEYVQGQRSGEPW